MAPHRAFGPLSVIIKVTKSSWDGPFRFTERDMSHTAVCYLLVQICACLARATRFNMILPQVINDLGSRTCEDTNTPKASTIYESSK